MDETRRNPMETRRSLVVSLHDVSPYTWERCRRILQELNRQDVSATSLLIVPNHHHRGHFRDNPEFCEWLRAQATAGHEPVIHGYYHQRPARPNESWKERLVTRGYTAGEGEFYDLTYEQAKELVSRARDDFEAVGLHPCGFIAPAWLLSEAAEQALRDLGIKYTTRLRGLYNLRHNEVEHSQSLCWSVRAAWRRAMSLAWNAVLFRRLESQRLMRVAIHPIDIGYPRIWQQITRLIATAQLHRRVMTYAQWPGI
jgi:uncharacterized protein